VIEKLAKEWDVPVKAVAADVLCTVHSAPCTVVFADPPYEFGRYDDLLAAIDRLRLTHDAIIAIEHRRKTDLASETKHLRFLRRAEYGEVWISMYAPVEVTKGE
jgi:16S rRNA G966 N2-methylase RsmD